MLTADRSGDIAPSGDVLTSDLGPACVKTPSNDMILL